jgi:hypothetical protein
MQDVENRKVIELRTNAHFVTTAGSNGVPELKMYIEELIDNEIFGLENRGRWFHHGGQQLCCVTDDIVVSGSRYCYEGEVHPGAGYIPELNLEKREARFSIDATLSNRITKESIPVTFMFISNINQSDLVRYLRRVEEYNQRKQESEERANDIINMFNPSMA